MWCDAGNGWPWAAYQRHQCLPKASVGGSRRSPRQTRPFFSTSTTTRRAGVGRVDQRHLQHLSATLGGTFINTFNLFVRTCVGGHLAVRIRNGRFQGFSQELVIRERNIKFAK
jgi:hypothetical protein